ncbi:MAG: hypothetical protein M1814_001900 [Vezdaea aestivalis]|nr:MAG: hypothetical protein M1814_001900 [Vezdaea aestivalis]
MQEDTKAPASDVASVMPSEATTMVNEPDMQRFTATGRPMKKEEISSLGNMSFDFMGQAPQNLPWRFTDDDIISVPVPIEDNAAAGTEAKKKGLFGKMHQKITGKTDKKFKVVQMTRREYLAKYAYDENGKYIGTEPAPKKS